jgi:membrane-bound serine protease (ClpP class)
MAGIVVAFLLCVLALVLLGAEDILPTGGALGILAACCLAFVLYLGFAESATTGLRYLAIEALVVPAGMAGSAWLVGRSGLGRGAYLTPPEAHEVAEGHGLDYLIGSTGRALTALRPSGMVEFEGRRLDGVAEEGLIEPGSVVEAVLVRSGRVIVRKFSEEPSARTP